MSLCHSHCLLDQQCHICHVVWGFIVLPSFIYLLYVLLLFPLFFVLLYLLTLSPSQHLPSCLPARGYRRLPKSRKRRCVINRAKGRASGHSPSTLTFSFFIAFMPACVSSPICVSHALLCSIFFAWNTTTCLALCVQLSVKVVGFFKLWPFKH